MKKNKKERQFRVKYSCTSETQGTVIYSIEDGDIPKEKGGAIDTEAFANDLHSEVEVWAEGYQNICEPPTHGMRDARPDWDTQAEDWSYFPDNITVDNIEEITAEEDVVRQADVMSLTQVCYIPFGKHKPKEMAQWGLQVDGFNVQIEAEPLEPSFKVEITRSYGVTSVDARNVLKVIARGDTDRMRTQYSSHDMEKLHKLFN